MLAKKQQVALIFSYYKMHYAKHSTEHLCSKREINLNQLSIISFSQTDMSSFVTESCKPPGKGSRKQPKNMLGFFFPFYEVKGSCPQADNSKTFMVLKCGM